MIIRIIDIHYNVYDHTAEVQLELQGIQQAETGKTSSIQFEIFIPNADLLDESTFRGFIESILRFRKPNAFETFKAGYSWKPVKPLDEMEQMLNDIDIKFVA